MSRDCRDGKTPWQMIAVSSAPRFLCCTPLHLTHASVGRHARYRPITGGPHENIDKIRNRSHQRRPCWRVGDWWRGNRDHDSSLPHISQHCAQRTLTRGGMYVRIVELGREANQLQRRVETFAWICRSRGALCACCRESGRCVPGCEYCPKRHSDASQCRSRFRCWVQL